MRVLRRSRSRRSQVANAISESPPRMSALWTLPRAFFTLAHSLSLRCASRGGATGLRRIAVRDRTDRRSLANGEDLDTSSEHAQDSFANLWRSRVSRPPLRRFHRFDRASSSDLPILHGMSTASVQPAIGKDSRPFPRPMRLRTTR